MEIVVFENMYVAFLPPTPSPLLLYAKFYNYFLCVLGQFSSLEENMIFFSVYRMNQFSGFRCKTKPTLKAIKYIIQRSNLYCHKSYKHVESK